MIQLNIDVVRNFTSVLQNTSYENGGACQARKDMRPADPKALIHTDD